jgi:hypothetical protein
LLPALGKEKWAKNGSEGHFLGLKEASSSCVCVSLEGGVYCKSVSANKVFFCNHELHFFPFWRLLLLLTGLENWAAVTFSFQGQPAEGMTGQKIKIKKFPPSLVSARQVYVKIEDSKKVGESKKLGT